MAEEIVRFNRVSKRFRLGAGHDSIRDLLAAGMRKIVRRSAGARRKSVIRALTDVDFSVARGEALGIIGPNGAGKSTALKILAGIVQPDSGEVSLRGRLAALIEVGAGFHGDLTGRENIYLNGAILGMHRAEVSRKLDDIVAFAGLERFLDTPVKRYSSGMYARLGFSIAAHVDPDVLLVDEVLSVGDAVFRLRCMDRMNELVSNGTTLILVTHNLDQMQSVCRRAVVLDRGRKVFDGSSQDAVTQYMQAISQTYMSHRGDLTDREDVPRDVELMGLTFHDGTSDGVVWTRSGKAISAKVRFSLRRPIHKLVIELNMRATVSENLVSINSGRDGVMIHAGSGVQEVCLMISGLPVRGGQYFWNVRMWDGDSGEMLCDSPFRYPLCIDDGGHATGILCVDHEWSIIRSKSTISIPKPGVSRDGDSEIRKGENENLPVR